MRGRKTPYLNRKFTLEILKTWMKAKGRNWEEEIRGGEQKDDTPHFNYPTQIVWMYTLCDKEEITKILTSKQAEEELYKKIVPMVADSPHLIAYALSQVEWAELIKRLREENNMMED